MSKQSLERQAERAERLADQTVDESLKETFLDAAREYRAQAEHEVPAQMAGQTTHRPAWLSLGVGLSEQPRSTTGF